MRFPLSTFGRATPASAVLAIAAFGSRYRFTQASRAPPRHRSRISINLIPNLLRYRCENTNRSPGVCTNLLRGTGTCRL